MASTADGRHERRACACSPDGPCPALALSTLPADQITVIAEAIWKERAARPAAAGLPPPSGVLASRMEAIRTGHRPGRRWTAWFCGPLRLAAVLAAGAIAWLVAGTSVSAPVRLAAVAAGALTVARWVQLTSPWHPERRRRAAERRTARALRAAQEAGYLVLHDLVVPGTQVRLGHLIVGVTGIWAVESQRWSWSKALQVRRHRRRALALRCDTPLPGAYDPSWHPAWLRAAAAAARSTACAVAEATTAPRPRIRPLVCVHGRMPGAGLLVGGVPVVAARQLVAALSRGPLLAERDLAVAVAGVLAVVRPAT